LLLVTKSILQQAFSANMQDDFSIKEA